MSILLGTFYFFYFGIVGIYIIFMPKVLSMVGYSGGDIGIIFAAGPLVRFLLPFAFTRGLQLDTRNFNISLLIMLLSAITFYFSLDSFTLLLLSNIGLGIGMSLTLPYIEVIALELIGKEKYGKIRLFGSIGFILVALVLVKFLTSPEVALMYLLCFISLTALLAFLVAKVEVKTKKKDLNLTNDITLLKDYKLWVGLALMQVSFGAFYNFFTIYETAYGVTLDMTINLWVFGVIVEIVMLYFQGRLLKFNLVLLLQITTFSAVIRWMLLFFFPQNLVILFFSQSLHALSFALFYTAAISYLHQIYANKVLAQQFYSGITFGLGGLVGALSFGYIYEYFPAYIFLVASFVAFVSFAFIFAWSKTQLGKAQ
jgi:MFS transporter, PPP family, 3-phenylpropionic acid transporter